MVFPDITIQPVLTMQLSDGVSEDDIEIMNGEIIEEMPSVLHALIAQIISGYLFTYLRQNPVGYALVEARYQLPDDSENALIPDLSYYSKQTGGIIRRGAAPFMPDLAVEVQSEGQSDQFMLDKGHLYLQKGVKMVWLVYAEKNVIEVLTANERQLLTLKDSLSGGDLLPGLQIPLAEVFPPEE